MDPLARLLGSPTRLKLLRLFLFNDDALFTLADAAFRAKASRDIVRKELTVLVASGVLKKRAGKGYMANKRFAHYGPLQAFVRDTTSVSDADIIGACKKAGSIRLITLTGLFSGAIETKIDLLVVGDRLEERPLGNAIRALEAELGRELRYAAFSTEDFKYRLGVYDRLLRDVFDYPHRTIIDKLGLTDK
jgi:hypothetical protein